MKVAIVHPWFLAHGGAEHTVNEFAALFPEADIFTLFYDEKKLPPNLHGRTIKALSWNWIPGKYQLYRYLLPLYPMAFESLDLRGYDLILSSDSSVTKGVLIDQGAQHICYCHSPMRCLWDLAREFRDGMPLLARPIFALGTHYVRQWDMNAAQRVDHFVANSKNVAERIEQFYRRESRLIYPPVNTKRGYLSNNLGDYYLSVGRLADTKRNDLLIEACNKLGRKLVIAGTGREMTRLKAIAGPTIHFAGRVSDEELGDLYARCRALLFASNEDFGIAPVEAQSYGRPVVALGRGGALETVVGAGGGTDAAPTGVYFWEQTKEAVIEGIEHFEMIEDHFDPILIRKHATHFDTEVFKRAILDFVDEVTGGKQTQEMFQELYRAFRLKNQAPLNSSVEVQKAIPISISSERSRRSASGSYPL